MRRFEFIAQSVSLLLAAALGGCAELPKPKGLELKPPKMAADSVVLEVFLVRLPPEEEVTPAEIWAEIDELSLPADLRQRLGARGFRAGLTAGRIPVELERLLQLAENLPTQSNDTALMDFQSESKVSRRILQMRSGRRGEIMASRIYERLSLFDRAGEQVNGQTYQQAQCCFAVSGVPQPDGRVRLELQSEVQHGAPHGQITPGDLTFVIETRRERVSLDELKIEVDLKPGQLLVLGSTESSDGSLGHYFFSEEIAGGEARRLVLVRLAQSQHEGLFAADDVGE